MFKFLKKLFSEPEEEETKEEGIKVGELEDWFKGKSDRIFSDLDIKIGDIRNRVNEEIIKAKDNLAILFGLLNLTDENLKGYDQNTVKTYETVSSYVKQEKTELLKEMEVSNKKIRGKRNKIVERFESFLKDNSLKKPIIRKVYL